MIAISYLTTTEIGATIAEHFGIKAVHQEPLGGERDQNLKVVTTDDETYFVKVVRDAPAESIEWHDAILAHLMTVDPTIPLPRLVSTRSGALRTVVQKNGRPCVLRLMTWLPGHPVATLRRQPSTLVREWGEVAGRISRGLATMKPPAQAITHAWDLRQAHDVVEDGLPALTDRDQVTDVRRLMSWFGAVQDRLDDLPRNVVHQDLNDANVLAAHDGTGTARVSGVVDVSDALYSFRVTEAAVAMAYSMLSKDDPLAAAAELVAGFHGEQPLNDDELTVVFPLAVARLCMNAVTWNQRVRQHGSAYGRDRMRHTWPTLVQLTQVDPALAEAKFRTACGLPRTKQHRSSQRALATSPARRPVLPTVDTLVELDTSVGSELFDGIDWTDRLEVSRAIAGTLGNRTRRAGVTRHLSASLLRARQRGLGADEPATVQLGAGLLVADGAVISTPLAGVVEQAPPSGAASERPLIVRHELDTHPVRTCWWGLEVTVTEGNQLEPGDRLGIADRTVDAAGMEPYVQVQVITMESLASGPPPRWIGPSDVSAWNQLSVDPYPLLGVSDPPTPKGLDVESIRTIRSRRIARSQRAYFRRPMNLVRGRGVWLYDEDGFGYLDALNNVTHVGHAEPRVVAASHRQMSRLNTNSRFLYEQIATYTEQLVATLPDSLDVVFLVCSGSEANDLALRIARQVTGRRDVINIDGAYHGNTEAVTGISPNRYKGPGGQGAPPTTHEAMIPDRYRGPYGYGDADAGAKYAADVYRRVDELTAANRLPAAFIAESLMGSAGNIILPEGYLREAFAAARAAGALRISDEVQVGMGRLGPFWGFELQDVVPDIVTMGKPLGNGHPLAAVVTTRDIANAFDTGMKYFNTFGGNPVSCAIGQTVLQIVQQDELQEHARVVGSYFLENLQELQRRHPLIGDVRGQGLYLGIELVRDRSRKEPATTEAFDAAELMKDRGVLVFPNGVHDNVLKVKPPMIFQHEHVDLFVQALDEVLTTLESR